MKAESNNMKLRWDGYIIIPRHALLILNDTKQFPESSRIKVVIITENVRSYGYRKFSSRTKWNCCNLQRRLFHSGKNSNGSFFPSNGCAIIASVRPSKTAISRLYFYCIVGRAPKSRITLVEFVLTALEISTSIGRTPSL